MNAIRASQLLDNGDVGIVPTLIALGVVLVFLIMMKKK